LSSYFSWDARETLFPWLPWNSYPARRTPFPRGPSSPWGTHGAIAARGALWAGHLTLGQLGLDLGRKFITSVPLHRLRVTGHHHPLKVYGLGSGARINLGDEDLAVEVYPGVHELERLLPHRLTVHIEHHLVPEDPKV